MKRVKIMLLSLALFAVVGGALAFKAKFSVDYCTALTGANGTCNFACPNIALAKTTVGGNLNFCTTNPRIKSDGTPVCTDVNGNNLQCNTSTTIKAE